MEIPYSSQQGKESRVTGKRREYSSVGRNPTGATISGPTAGGMSEGGEKAGCMGESGRQWLLGPG